MIGNKRFSLLYPRGKKVYFMELEDSAFHDLGLDVITKEVSSEPKEQSIIHDILANLSPDPDVTNYRQDIFEDLRNLPDIRKKLEEHAEKHADDEVEGKILDKVIENMTAEIPQVMFDNRVNEMMMDLEQRLAPQGITMEMYCQFTGQDIESVKKAYKEQAEKQVKLRLALEKIAQLENVEVTDDEAAAEMQKIADQYKMKIEQVKQYINEEDVKKDIAVGKAVEIVKNSAVIK